ncbi:helix-turn-helix domain-containing protein [Nocardia sp. BSTN01]|uniref:helix-turn-helix domain-containing protein n=1 Tax=Nocardia sp. BSTN01 TaxID=2783665 RepID=UPI00188E79FA|nr:helix-turn-helix domain-containing protein [Nocardia sp. BSTN01]MBF5002203.1 helix-turn-helix domain-containing protein [Nocardia sp. BSTN01]
MNDRRALGDFLRARRARVQPSQVGLPPGTRRRQTAGLRREEVAALAGLSVDYYIRLEQGRDRNPSPEVLAALASALLLNSDEAAHLHRVARLAGARSAAAAAPVEPAGRGMVLLLESVRPTPAFVLDQVSNLLAANPEGLRLLWGIEEWEPVRRNLIRYVFTHPAARTVFEDWTGMARDCVAHLRVVQGAGSHPVELAALTDELCAATVDFEALWAHYDVRAKRGTRRMFRHPAVGRMELTSEILTAADGQRFVAFQAEPGSPDRDAVTLLGLVGDDVPERGEGAEHEQW